MTGTNALTYMYNEQCFSDQNMQIHFIVKRSTEELPVQIVILQYGKLNVECSFVEHKLPDSPLLELALV